MSEFLQKARSSNTVVIIASILIFLLIALLGGLYNYDRLSNSFNREIASNSELVINRIDKALDKFNRVAKGILAVKNKTCEEEEYKLKKIVASSDFIRSITITHNDMIFCSSVYKLIHSTYVDVKPHTDKDLNLFKSSHLTPSSPSITYSVRDGDWAVFVTMPGNAFVRSLQYSNFQRESYVVINNNWINAENEVFLNEAPVNQDWLRFSSKKYPFEVVVDYVAIKNSSQAILSFIILAIVLLVLIVIVFIYIAMTAAKRDFRRAIIEDELVPYYQLVVSSADFKWHGVEVLTRWKHPKLGLIMPSGFISLAERTGLVIPMTKMLMRKVATELSFYINCLPKPFFVSFNIHATHLNQADLLDDCKEFLSKFPLGSVHLTLELAESQFVESSDKLDALLYSFHKMDISIAIDDFGTGYSNLGYLQKYTIDHLKIDRLFVSTIDKKIADSYLVDTIIDLAKKLKLNTVAEGVETIEQLNYLISQNVEYIQGFLFNKPSPIQGMIKALLKPYTHSLHNI